ncbi:MAG: NACHT domain-containing NTPase, partial [Anaerolineales bacterium]
IDQNEASGSTLPFPVFIRAKDLELSDDKCIEASLLTEVSRFSPHSEPSELLPDDGYAGVIVLIDGIDELKDEGLILNALARVSQFASLFPASRTIATMRTMDILDSPEVLAEFSILELEELSRAQMGQFIENWFGKGSPVGARLAQFLQDPLTLHGLPSTPLTLAIVAILYASGAREVPANLTELFSKYVELALGRWDESKGVSHQFEWRVKEFLLRGIAWEMQDNRMTSMSSSEVDGLTSSLGDDRGLDLNPVLFREEVADRSELLIIDEDGEYEFKHRSFQDYFVGIEIVSKAKAIDIVVANFLDSWWEAAVFFACGLRPESEEFLDSIMRNVAASGTAQYGYAVNLGMAAQASYLAPRRTKRQAVDLVLDTLLQAWGAVALDYANLEDKPELPAFISPHLLLLGVFTGASQQALGSITLAPVLKDIAREYLDADLSSMSPDERKILEWKAFFLSVALASCGEIDDFADIFESKIIGDPALHLAGMFPIVSLSEQDWLPSQSKRRLRRVEKRLKKSLKSNSAYIKSLAGSEPMPITGQAIEQQSGGIQQIETQAGSSQPETSDN